MDLRLPAAAGELTRAEQKILDYINTNTDTLSLIHIYRESGGSPM